MLQQNNPTRKSDKANVQSALLAINEDAKLSTRRASKIYNIAEATLRRRCAGTPSRRDCAANSMNLRSSEEVVIVRHVLKLVEQGFPPRLADVEDMANSLLTSCYQKPVGKNWAANFVKRRPELKVKFNRKYDYRRALCKDSEVIGDWFRLVHNIKAKYGMLDEDTYNFDETGFMMGYISTGAVVTGSDYRGWPKTVQQGNREWTTVIQGINATGWATPPFIIFQGKHHLSAW
jgi:hypothetical protein